METIIHYHFIAEVANTRIFPGCLFSFPESVSVFWKEGSGEKWGPAFEVLTYTAASSVHTPERIGEWDGSAMRIDYAFLRPSFCLNKTLAAVTFTYTFFPPVCNAVGSFPVNACDPKHIFLFSNG